MCKQPTKLENTFKPEMIAFSSPSAYRRKLALKIKETLQEDDQTDLAYELDKMLDEKSEKVKKMEFLQNDLVK